MQLDRIGIVKLFISTNSINLLHKKFPDSYVLADKINTFELNESPFGSGNYTITGALDSGTRIYHIYLGDVGEENANCLLRQLFDHIARTSASGEPRALLLGCRDGEWRQE